MLKKVLFVLFVPILLFGNITEPKGSLKGKIVDLETKLPLIGVNVFIKNTNIGTASDEKGNYVIPNLEVGTYAVTFSYIGFEPVTKTDVVVRSKKTTFLNAELKSSLLEMENVVVNAGFFSEIENKPVSTTNFSSEEIRRAPGSAGDVSRILFGLPSLAKVNDQRNSLIVRGGSPVENSFYLDNIEIPNINHFPVQGSSDGPIGLINVDFIEDVNFHSGGFSAAYGNRLSSIMELNYREGNKDKIEPQLNISMQGFGGTIEGPIGTSGTYMAAYNRSYLDLILNPEETGGAMPQYSDAQGKVTYKLDDNNQLTVLDIFSVDQINLDYENAIKTNVTNIYGSTDGVTNTAGLNWKYIWGKNGYSNTSISHIYNKYDRGYNETLSKRKIFSNNSVENSIRLRNINYFKLDETQSFEFGAEVTLFNNDFDLYYNTFQNGWENEFPELYVKKQFNTTKTGLFATHNWNISENLKLSYGLRTDYFEYNDALNISPRINMSYSIDDKTSATFSFGVFYQDIPNNVLIQNEKFKDLATPMANHYILGLSRMIGESTRLTVEAYYKNYENFPVDPTTPNEFLFDQTIATGLFLSHDNLVDDGKAVSQGIEVMLQKKLAEDFYGLIAGSYSQAKYQNLNGEWKNRIYDNRFNFTLEGGYVPNNEWEFKLRWIYAGGAPYTPFNTAASVAAQKGIYDNSRINAERYPDYHSLNLRVDKRFNFSGSNLIVYLSIWNVYNRENIAMYVWNEVENKLDSQSQWSTLPVLGIEFKF